MTSTWALAAGSDASEALQRFDVPLWLWPVFLGGVAALLLIDLLVLHREAHEISMREAAVTSAGWVSLGVAFTLVVWAVIGWDAAGQYLTGFVIEKSLSVDNVFVWAVIFTFFSVPGKYQHRVLFWGIFGALVLRAIFIFAGVALLERLSWLLFVFGGLLIFTAIRVVRHTGEEIHPEEEIPSQVTSQDARRGHESAQHQCHVGRVPPTVHRGDPPREDPVLSPGEHQP